MNAPEAFSVDFHGALGTESPREAPRPGESLVPGVPVDRPPVLLAMADYYGTLAAVRSLGRFGVRVHVADPQRLAPARWSRRTSRTFSCPRVEESPEEFLEWLLALGQREPGQVLLPTSDELAWFFARHREALSQHFRLGGASLEAMDTVLNKWALARACAASGVATPATFLPRDDAELTRLQGEIAFPVLVKPQTQVFMSPVMWPSKAA